MKSATLPFSLQERVGHPYPFQKPLVEASPEVLLTVVRVQYLSDTELDYESWINPRLSLLSAPLHGCLRKSGPRLPSAYEL